MALRHIISTLIIAHPLPMLAQQTEGGHGVLAAPDSVIHLRQTEVRGQRRTASLKTTADGSIIWNTAHLDLMPRILGNADPIHYTQMLPGVQTTNEYRSSINVQGCDNAHSAVTLGRVPIYNAVHLLGIFSTFNTHHNPAFTLRKTAADALHPSRLGALLDMELPLPDDNDSTGRAVTGHLEAGLVASQATLKLRPTHHTLVTLSGRLSYVNLLYGPLLNTDDTQLHYTFGDLNATFAHRHRRHTIAIDTYFGRDRANFDIADANAAFDSHWGNNAQAIHWTIDLERGRLRTTAYHTGYANRFALSMLDSHITLPAHIDEAALTTLFTLPSLRRQTAAASAFTIGLEAIYRNALPQVPDSDSPNAVTTHAAQPQHAIEFALPLQYTLPITNRAGHSLTATIGLRSTLYATVAAGPTTAAAAPTTAVADPSLRIDYAHGPFTAALTAATRHQYVFQTGFSDMGLPSEFWILADARHHAQASRGISAEAALWLPRRTWRITVDAFYKRLYNQIEYDGNVFSVLTTSYDLDRILRPGHGHNWGASIMMAHPTGPLTGWIAYSYTRARRQFATPTDHTPHGTASTENSFPASHERPHEFNAVATYSIKDHWALSATVVAASGTPFTAPTAFYILGGNLISQFADHNANRLPPYFRTDISASYTWKRRHAGHTINLSIYNCTARKNAIFYTIHFDKQEQRYAYAPTSFFTRVLPSLSYALNF